MAAIWRSLEKSCCLLRPSQRLIVTKAATVQDDKTEKKTRRKEERKEIVKEITKGYFADLREFRKNGGKRFFALGRPSELKINVVDGLFFKPFSRLLEKNLRKQRPKERHDTFLCYSGNTKQIKENFLENIIVGHAFLVDCNGRVRWKAHANPTDEEIKFMLDCSKLLLKETTRTLCENKAISLSR